MGKTKSDYNWMKERLEILLKFGDQLDHIGDVNEYGAYTALKLISVNYYSTIFSGVARHQNQRDKGFDGAVYIDLFAGAGLVKLTDTGDYVGGSVPCAMLNSNGFDYCVAIEKNKKRAEALQNRLEGISDRDSFVVINDDCNNCINQVISRVKQRFDKPIVLTFVDPEGMEIKWETLEALNSNFFSCDFIVNVSSSGSLRVAGKLKKGMNEVEGNFSAYWGEDAEVILSDFAEGKEPEQRYQDKIKALGRIVGENIPIRDVGQNILYYLLGYTRMTSGGSQYASAFATLNRRFKTMDKPAVVNILNQINNRGTATLF